MEHSFNSHPKLCLLCDNKTFTKFLYPKDYFLTGEEFGIFQCDRCGLHITWPIPAISDLQSYYASENYISHADKRTGAFGKIYHLVRKYTHRKKFKLINRFSKGRSILDIGCATGEFLRYCQDKGMIVAGIEPNEKARLYAISEHNLQIGNELDLGSLETASQDFITMWHVLEHVPDINQRMADISRLLKKDGTAFIALPNHASYDAGYYKEHWAAWDVPRHLYHFDRKSFQLLASKHGFRVFGIIPMYFDSYYVSLLSEKYKRGKTSLINAIFLGFWSNLKAFMGNREYSSLIYVIKKD
ncbi:MAG: class I SAM-dependent methyltransferase [Bacteroidota bacterium]